MFFNHKAAIPHPRSLLTAVATLTHLMAPTGRLRYCIKTANLTTNMQKVTLVMHYATPHLLKLVRNAYLAS